MSWTSGYVSEIDYTYGYYRELAPGLLSLALLSRAQAHRAGQPLRYLELGFGQGLSLNIHAAACAGEFWGIDFNPAQVANARELADASGADLRLLDQSFAEFAARDELPEFDVIALHGIWSWISDDNRRAIVDIARRRLAVGGIFYVSYNCTPGWSAAMPLRRLMTLHAELASGEAQGMIPRIDAAIAFAQQLVDNNAAYFRANPGVAPRLAKIKEQNRHYLAHEYFNADWAPMPFSDLAAAVEEAKLSFAASASLLDHVDAINLAAPLQTIVNGIGHPVLRESVRDYCVNQQFRRDLWVKGARTLTAAEQMERLRELRFALTLRAEDVPLKIAGAAGEATLDEAVYRPLLATLAAEHYAPKTLAQLQAQPGLKTLPVGQLVQALLLLTGAGHLHPAQADAAVEAVRSRCAALNARILERAVYGGEIGFMASPVLGGAVPVGRFQQLFLRALARGQKKPAQWASDAWATISSQGQRLVRDGKPLDGAEENIAELERQAEDFNDKRLPTLRALGVA